MNEKIRCSVCECKHQNRTHNTCELESIVVGKSTNNVDCCECTECSSFES